MLFLQQQYVHLMKVSLLKFPVQGVLLRVAIDLVNSFVRSVSGLTFAFGTSVAPTLHGGHYLQSQRLAPFSASQFCCGLSLEPVQTASQGHMERLEQVLRPSGQLSR